LFFNIIFNNTNIFIFYKYKIMTIYGAGKSRVGLLDINKLSIQKKKLILKALKKK